MGSTCIPALIVKPAKWQAPQDIHFGLISEHQSVRLSSVGRQLEGRKQILGSAYVHNGYIKEPGTNIPLAM